MDGTFRGEDTVGKLGTGLWHRRVGARRATRPSVLARLRPSGRALSRTAANGSYRASLSGLTCMTFLASARTTGHTRFLDRSLQIRSFYVQVRTTFTR